MENHGERAVSYLWKVTDVKKFSYTGMPIEARFLIDFFWNQSQPCMKYLNTGTLYIFFQHLEQNARQIPAKTIESISNYAVIMYTVSLCT